MPSKSYRQLKEGSRNLRDVTISYENTRTKQVRTEMGMGKTYLAAIDDADARLPQGEWLRVVISTPQSVFSDTLNQGRARALGFRKAWGEGKIVRRS